MLLDFRKRMWIFHGCFSHEIKIHQSGESGIEGCCEPLLRVVIEDRY